MRNKELAIRGHSTRGKEVIEILEMLGGWDIKCTGADEGCIYTIYGFGSKYNNSLHDHCKIFTLEDFLEKYPFKVGDKVLLDNQVKIIKGIGWDSKNNEVVYTLETNINGVKQQYQAFNYDLQPFKEEIKAEDHTEIYTDPAIDDDSKTDIIINGEKLIAPNGYTIGNATRNSNKLIVEYIKNKPQYPETFEECCNVLQTYCTVFSRHGYKEEQIALFQKLLICRDAYWKIAGEEMGLSEPWKPDWNDGQKYKFVIMCSCNDITKESYVIKNAILAFPTEEMRDTFLENFKELIEECKEFL